MNSLATSKNPSPKHNNKTITKNLQKTYINTKSCKAKNIILWNFKSPKKDL
jgi:hypothetical protein